MMYVIKCTYTNYHKHKNIFAFLANALITRMCRYIHSGNIQVFIIQVLLLLLLYKYYYYYYYYTSIIIIIIIIQVLLLLYKYLLQLFSSKHP